MLTLFHFLELLFIGVYTLQAVFNTVILELMQSNVTITFNPAGRWVTVVFLICVVHVLFWANA